MTTKYEYNPKYKVKNSNKLGEISVVDIDILECAKQCFGRVLVLNMANDKNPGGFYDRVKTNNIIIGQEEYLFHNTNISEKLTRDFYPISEKTALLSQNIRINNSDKSFDIISCPAVNVWGEQFGTNLSEKNAMKMYLKISTIFQVADINDYDIVILSAFGCGGFCCPPEHVSYIFKELLSKFKHCFDKVIFAIKQDEKNPVSNYNIFRNTLLENF